MNNTFIKVFLFIFLILLFGIICALAYGFYSKLKIIPAIFVTVAIVSFFCSVAMAAIISSNMKSYEIEIKDKAIKSTLKEIIESKNYVMVDTNNQNIVYQLKSFPNFIYKDIKVIIKKNSSNKNINMRVPKYLVKEFE